MDDLAVGVIGTGGMGTRHAFNLHCRVVGARGTVETAQPDRAVARVDRRRALSVPQDWLDRFQPAYVAELQEWTDALREGRPFSGASAWDGYMASRVAEACIESLRSGMPASLPVLARPDLYG